MVHGVVYSLVRLPRRVCLGAVVALGIASLAGGQPAGDQAMVPDPVVSSHLARSAVLDLGLRLTPTPTDYLLAANLLSIASDLDPTNADLARSVVESAYSAGDREMMIRATRRVIANDPLDTVAQLRLVSSVINRQQTVDGRLKLYDRFLGEAGKSFDPSVRSRLALDAALLEREQGNMTGFIERLHLATKLDPSHKSAASLSAQLYGNTSFDPVTLLDYQFKLLFADPLDPNVHMTIVRILASEGAYAPARRFLDNAINLYKLESGRAPSSIDEIRLALSWQLDGPRSLIDELNPILSDRRAEAQSRIDAYIEADLPMDDLMAPEEIRYDISIDKLRLLASYNLNDEEMTKDILNDIESTVNADVLSVAELMGNRGVDQNALRLRVVGMFSDFQVMRAIVGLEGDEIRTDIANIIEAVPVLEPYFSSIEPMALYAEGNFDRSLNLARELPDSRVLEVLIGLSLEKLGRTEEAVEVYARLTRMYALDAYGAFARSRMVELGVGEKTLTGAGKQMIQIAGTIPNWIDQMNRRPSTFIGLAMDPPTGMIGVLDRPTIRIRLKNLAPIPLAVGPSQPLDSRFLLAPRIDDQSYGFVGEVRPKVVELNHRFRLRPLEEMVVEVPADSVATQWLLMMQANSSIRQRWRLLQGFRPRRSDMALAQVQVDSQASIYGVVQSPLGLTDESGVVQRAVLEESSMAVDALVEQLASDDELARRRAVLACAGRLLLPAPGFEFSQEDQQAVIDALIETYTHAKGDERARMALILPHRHQVPAMMAFDDHVVRLILSDALIDSRVDPVVLACALLTRTDAADSPIFEVLDQVNDPRLMTIAGIIRARLETNTPTLGLIGPGVESVFPNKQFVGP
jgi:tetratricopeptide (TPR) repeat protein